MIKEMITVDGGLLLELRDDEVDALEAIYQDLKRLADDARVRVVVAKAARNKLAEELGLALPPPGKKPIRSGCRVG
jgi:hypothetical protein